MTQYINRAKLQVASELDNFIMQQALPNSGISAEEFWTGFESLLSDLVPINQALLAHRDNLQQQIDDFHSANKNADFATYKAFLTSIGYLQDAPNKVSIDTQNVDDEIATIAGPQLVVPINNARYALNAANARWGSLYDALYGTDVLSEEDGAHKGGAFNPVRGQKVIESAKQWLDIIAPLAGGSHRDASAYQLENGHLTIVLSNNTHTQLADPKQYQGYQGSQQAPDAILIKNNNLHIEIQIDAQHNIGKTDPAHVKDILVESAITTIMDCEDSVAAVDAEDKTLVYQNWLGLVNGTLSIDMQKGDKLITRSMNPDRHYQGANGEFSLSGRSLMFVRNVGHLMTNDAILFNGEAIPEGIMDAVITCLVAKHDLLKHGAYQNSRTGSIYIVKPKMHGPDEVAFTNTLFARVESMLGLQNNTIKMGIMDEERRTSVNLLACIAAAKSRVVFINTGFLDRTGDEIHTSMRKGAFAPKAELKARPWISAYESSNVASGLQAGLQGKAQIGKGMWPIPDQMANMMSTKIAHPEAGASCAWVPSPTAATLHALHYHQVNVHAVQKQLALKLDSQRFLDTILEIPLLEANRKLSADEIKHELDNNVQGILGYVVRWVHQGIGCSKVPDINNVGLMEDRATLRISSQHLANWLEHGLLSVQQIDESLQRMAVLVDQQNMHDEEYIAMTPDIANSIGYQAARDLIILGKVQPSGYTEPLLHESRKQMKAKLAKAN